MFLFIDLGAAALYLIFLGVLYLLVSFIFDVQKTYKKTRTLRYLKGHPKFKDLENVEGVINLKNKRFAFVNPREKKILFSIPIGKINGVSTEEDAVEFSSKILNTCSKVLSEDSYLFVNVDEGGDRYTLKFSSHKLSPVSKEVKSEILKAKTNT